MEAKVYVYAYLLLSVLYLAGCIAYLNIVTRTVSLARKRQEPEGVDAAVLMASEESRQDTQSAVRAVLTIDSAAFACAVVPVAYVAVTGLLGNLLSRNPNAATVMNPLWLLATVAVVLAHMLLLSRITGSNSQLNDSGAAVLTPSFVSRHASMLTYYRAFIAAVAMFTAANSLLILANLNTITKLPYVL